MASLERCPDYAAVLRRHVGTTQGRIGRLEQALTASGESPSTRKEAVTKVVGSIGAAIHATAQDETL